MSSVVKGALLAASVALAAALDLVVALRSDGEPLPPEVWAEARAQVAALARPGDVRVHSPLFRAEELAALGDGSATPHVPTPSIRASRRVLVVDRTDHPIFGLGVPSAVHPIEASQGAIEVRVFEPVGGVELVRVSLSESLSPNTMHIERPVGVVSSRCTTPRDEGGFGCPGEPDWLYAARRSLRVGGEEVACVWAHPTNGGAIALQLPAQEPPPSGRRLVISVRAGLTDDAVQTTPDGAPVRTEILQGAESRGAVLVPNAVGFQRGRFSIDPGAPVVLRITTARDGRRHHCVEAEILEIDSEGTSP